MDKSITGSCEWDAYGVAGSKKRLHIRELKQRWDLVLATIENAANWEGLAMGYGQSTGFVEALYYAGVIDQENSDALRLAREKVYALATDRLAGAQHERA